MKLNENKFINALIPNLLTASRLLAPIVIPYVAKKNNKALTLSTIGAFAITDYFDGKVARKLNAESEFGTKLDPICDKMFAFGLILPLIADNPELINTISLEGIISVINIKSSINGNDPKSSIIGKAKTWSLFGTIIAFYLELGEDVLIALYGATTAMQIITALDYLKEYNKNEKTLKKELK